MNLSFEPTPEQWKIGATLGLLGKIEANNCLLEPFRNQPSPAKIRSCMLKLFSIHAEKERTARREKRSLKESDLPHLWILATSASDYCLIT